MVSQRRVGTGESIESSGAIEKANYTDELSFMSQELCDEDLQSMLAENANQSGSLLKTVPKSLHFPLTTSLRHSLRVLDLSRNGLRTLPPEIKSLLMLQSLNVSRNKLVSIPSEIGQLLHLTHLNALSNHLKLTTIPITELAALPKLASLDLRYNPKLKESARLALMDKFDTDRVEILVTTAKNKQNTTKLSAGERDATQLRSQLEPYSTPQLKKRLQESFGVCNVENEFDREHVMQRVLECYAAAPSRTIRRVQGTAIDSATLESLLVEMKAIEWPGTTRERPKISAEQYMILQRPTSANLKSKNARLQASKLERYQGIWNKALEAIDEVDKEFADRFTALAVTKDFRGSPHIDTLNIAPFYAISMGDFDGGGKICVECSPMEVAEVETKGRFAKVDGRFPHWVTPYTGTRYSLIYYVTSGEVVPQTTAVFEPTEHERK